MIQNDREFNILLDSLLPFGQQMLNKHSTFLPYAAVVVRDGTVALVAGDTGEGQTNPNELFELLILGLQKQVKEQECCAAGICIDVSAVDPRNGKKGDALRFLFEHRSGEAWDIVFPYSKKFFRGYQYEKPFATESERRIFQE